MGAYLSVVCALFLYRVSSYVRDTEECGVLLSLLLPFVSAAKYKVKFFMLLVCVSLSVIRFQKHQEGILVTLQNLLLCVDNVKGYLR